MLLRSPPGVNATAGARKKHRNYARLPFHPERALRPLRTEPVPPPSLPPFSERIHESEAGPAGQASPFYDNKGETNEKPKVETIHYDTYAADFENENRQGETCMG